MPLRGSEGGRIDETKNPLHGITLELRRDAAGMATATVIDGKADVGIYDKTTNTFGIVLSGGGTLFQSIGNPANNLVPVAGDDQSTIVFVVLA